MGPSPWLSTHCGSHSLIGGVLTGHGHVGVHHQYWKRSFPYDLVDVRFPDA
jgi:hypothetical protein